MVFWTKPSLFSKIYAPQNLVLAWQKTREAHGAAGPDGITIDDFERNRDVNLLMIQQSLEQKTYKPGPARFVEIVGKHGKVRKLGINNVVDRVVQRATLNVLLPLFESRFLNSSYGYRPSRSVKFAAKHIQHLHGCGYEWVVDADIKDYFGSVNHSLLKNFIIEDVPDRRIVKLLLTWLHHYPANTVKRFSLLPATPIGLMQGAVINPLLSNIYLHRFDEAMLHHGFQLVRYCDDFLIMCDSFLQAKRAWFLAKYYLFRLRLRLNAAKSRLIQFNDGFNFLGCQFGNQRRPVPQPVKKKAKPIRQSPLLLQQPQPKEESHEHSVSDDPGMLPGEEWGEVSDLP